MRIIIFFLLCFIANASWAATAVKYHKPRSMAGNPHIKFLTYGETAIHKYKGFYGMESSILFEQGESFDMIVMGDAKAWQINPVGNRLFLRPLDEGANTNATIITSIKSRGEKRVYLFQMEAAEARDLDDEELAYEVRMVYPHLKVFSSTGGAESSSIGSSAHNSEIPNLGSANLNFEYRIAGSNDLRPVKAFDDGKFTYLEFRADLPLPAVFVVDNDGYESIVNFRRVGNYIVLETVESLLSLRRGDATACLFNEMKPFVTKAIKKRSRGVFSKSSQ